MHIYKRELVESQGTHLILPSGELGQCWRIGYPQEGRITRLIVKQLQGTSSAFAVDLFDRQVCDVGSGSSASMGDDPDDMTRAMARIIPRQTVLAGATMELREGSEDGGPWSYRNRQGTFTVPDRAVYLFISVDSNDDGMQFEAAIECEVGNES